MRNNQIYRLKFLFCFI